MPLDMGVDFFIAELPAAAQIQTVIETIEELPLRAREHELREEQMVRLEGAQFGWQNCVEGEMARLRFTALPEKGARGRRLEALGLPPEAGVGDRCAFLYDTRSHALLLQKNRTAISARGLAAYLNAKGEVADKIEFQPVLTEEAYRKLVQMPEIRRLEVGLAAPRNVGAMYRGQEGAVRTILNARDALQAPTAQFVFSAGRGQESLPRRVVMQAVRDLIAMREEDEKSVKKIRVVAIDPNEEPALFDLISERMRDAEQVEPARERSVPYERRRTALRQVWNRHRQELHRMFAEREERRGGE